MQIERPLTEEALLLLTGYRKSGTWDSHLSALRNAGRIVGSKHGLDITAAGRKAIGTVTPLPVGPALLAYWEGKLGACAGSLLRLVLYNEPKNEAEALDLLDYKKSGSWDSAVGTLRKLGLFEPRGDFRVTAEARKLLAPKER